MGDVVRLWNDRPRSVKDLMAEIADLSAELDRIEGVVTRLRRQLYSSSSVSPERLEKPWHEHTIQHPGRREHIYGSVHPMGCKCGGCNV